ncbi:MAG: hypothetical protein HC859_10140 [Bacteroidia bacterium]|nr:hypothetical protein [Bacteroidia bacterium]
MNWGKGVFLAFVSFAALVAGLVTVSMRQDVNLVTQRYYEEEMNYQAQQERMMNTRALTVLPKVVVSDSGHFELQYASLRDIQDGEIVLFRPSSSRLDQRFTFRAHDDSVAKFVIRPTTPGMYRVQITWSMHDKSYYMEQIVNL